MLIQPRAVRFKEHGANTPWGMGKFPISRLDEDWVFNGFTPAGPTPILQVKMKKVFGSVQAKEEV
jgi:hypothetical protein